MRMGYRPTTLNPFDILLSSATSVNRITTAARFVDELSRVPIADGAAEMMVMPADKAPDYYVDYPSPLLAGMAVHPELLGGTARGYSDQSHWDRLLKFAGGLDILDRVTGAADFDWAGRGGIDPRSLPSWRRRRSRRSRSARRCSITSCSASRTVCCS
jgi:hypothetical protein